MHISMTTIFLKTFVDEFELDRLSRKMRFINELFFTEISQVFSLLPGGGLQMIMTAIKDKKTLVIKRVFDVVVG